MKLLRNLLLLFGVLVLLLVGAIILIPILFKDQLVTAAKEIINDQVNAKVEFQDVGLGLWRHFPNLTLSLEELTVDGNAPFEDIRLLDLQRLDLDVDLFSILFGDGNIVLRSVRLVEPDLKVYVLQNGSANYDIAIASNTTPDTAQATSSTDYRLELRSYEIINGNLIYDDRPADLYAKIEGLNHRGSGNFSETVFDLDTKTSMQALTVTTGGTTYLNKAVVDLESTLAVDQAQSRYKLQQTLLSLNELDLQLVGEVGLLEADKMDLDLELNAPGNNFKSLLSMIPGAYTQDFEQVKTEGDFSLRAGTKGIYDPSSTDYPQFNLDLNIANGKVQYPDLPLPVSNIALTTQVDHPGGELDRMQININPFQMQIGDNPFKGRLALKTPISDPDIDTDIKGVIDLATLSQAIPMEGVEALTGKLTVDLAAKARLSQIERGVYDQVDMSGNLKTENLTYQGAGMPMVTLENAGFAFSPQFVEVQQFSAQLGKSDLSGRGRIDNILAWFSPEKTMTGSFNLRSNYFDANEWTVDSTAEEDAQEHEIEVLNAEAELEMEPEAELFDRYDLRLDARFNQIDYEEYDIRNARVIGQMNPKLLEVKELAANIETSDLSLNGELLHVMDYLMSDGMLTGKINLNSNRLNLNELLGLDEEVSEEPPMTSEEVDEEAVYEIPDNINLVIGANIGRVDYTNMVLNDLRGEVVIRDEAAVLNGVSAKALGGRINLTGRYDTKGEGNPEVALKMGLEDMAFQQAFTTFNTFERLAPIGKFISGNFNTDLLFEGEVGENMYPVLTTIDAEGFLETFGAVINQFKPVTAVGNALNVQALKEAIPLENTKNWFEIKDGTMEIKPVKINVKDMGFVVTGKQGLNLDMDYSIAATIPRSVWENNAVGAVASKGVDELRNQASKLGISWEKSEYIDLNIGLAGTLSNPTVKFNLLGAEGSASLGDLAKKEAQAKANEALDEGKEKAQALLDEAQDSALSKADELLDDAVQKAKERVTQDTNVQKALEDVGKKAGAELGKALGDTSKTVETIKKELEKFNPFKRKKSKTDTTKSN